MPEDPGLREVSRGLGGRFGWLGRVRKEVGGRRRLRGWGLPLVTVSKPFNSSTKWCTHQRLYPTPSTLYSHPPSGFYTPGRVHTFIVVYDDDETPPPSQRVILSNDDELSQPFDIISRGPSTPTTPRRRRRETPSLLTNFAARRPLRRRRLSPPLRRLDHPIPSGF
jgi:hypothetical protein